MRTKHGRHKHNHIVMITTFHDTSTNKWIATVNENKTANDKHNQLEVSPVLSVQLPVQWNYYTGAKTQLSYTTA